MDAVMPVLAVALLLALGFGVRRAGLLRRLLLARYPLLFAALLVAFGPLAVAVFPRLLRNLLVLPPSHLALVACLATQLAWVVMITYDMVRRYGPYRFAGLPAPAAPPPVWRWRLPAFALLGVPLVACAAVLSPGPWWQRLLAPAAGWLAAWLLLLVAIALQVLLFGPVTARSDFLVPHDSWTWRTVFAHRWWTRRLTAAGPWLATSQGPGGEDGEDGENGEGGEDGESGEEWEGGRVEVGGTGDGPAEGFWAGYRGGGPGRARGSFLVGHLVAGIFLFVNLVLYAAGFFLLRPDPQPAFAFPSLGYLLLVLVLAGWAVPAGAFFLDRYRVPPLLVLLCLSIALHAVRDSGHYFPVTPPAEGGAPGAAEAVARRPAGPPSRGPDDRPVVLVAASGGGITAAQWTARVLAGLQCELGDDFAASLRLVSAVSGGSVGTLHYLDRFTPGGPPAADDLAELVAAAGESSLDAVAWGIAYPDLWRVFGAGPVDAGLDRGWAKERAWLEHLGHGDGDGPRLSDWRSGVAAGWLPPAVFNATAMESGERYRFTSFDVPAAWDGLDFTTEMPGHDLPVVRAARLSATFPWVSPIAGPCRHGGDGGRLCAGALAPAPRLADGGYYDNFGVSTLVQWLHHLRPDERAELARRGLLLVQIRAWPEDDAGPRPAAAGLAAEEAADGAVAEGGAVEEMRRDLGTAPGTPAPRESLSGTGLPERPGSWLTATLGPVFTLLSSRTASQAEGNRLELAELEARLAAGEDGVDVVDLRFHLSAPAPLSWKLTPEEAAAVRCGFHDPRIAAEVARARRRFAARDGAAGGGLSCGADLDRVTVEGRPATCDELREWFAAR